MLKCILKSPLDKIFFVFASLVELVEIIISLLV